MDKNTLTAVLIYEMMDPEAKFSELTGGFEAPALYAKRGATGSYGIAQLEVYKARMVLQKYKGKVFSEGLRGNVQIVALPIKSK